MRLVNEMALQPLQMCIDPALCNRCGVCVPLCPVQAIGEGDECIYISQEECTACAFCVENCARHAITAVTSSSE